MFKSNSFNPNAGNGSSKIMNPGTHFARVIDIQLDAPPYDKEAYSVVLTLEGQDMGDDFQGLPVNKLNPAMGNYRGQIANVRSGRYPFSTYNYQGKDIMRDDQIFRWINNLAKQMGVLDKMNADNVEASNIEEYVAAVKRYVVNPELWGFFTLGGAEYFTEGYDKPNYRLFFPKAENKLFPYSALIDNDGNPVGLLAYDKAKHIVVKAPDVAEEVPGFGGQQAPILNNAFGTGPGAPISFNTAPIAPSSGGVLPTAPVVAPVAPTVSYTLPGQVVPPSQPATLDLP